MGESNVTAPETLPSWFPTVNTTRLLLPVPDDTRQLNVVSDSHVVRGQLLAPARVLLLDAETPSPAPCTVTRDDPVPA